MKVRAVKLTFKNGLTVVGLLPADFSDEDLAAAEGDDIMIEFSDVSELPASARVATVLQRLAAAAAMNPEVLH
jgi:hypothetical protein